MTQRANSSVDLGELAAVPRAQGERGATIPNMQPSTGSNEGLGAPIPTMQPVAPVDSAAPATEPAATGGAASGKSK